jgi:hypothetical protein
VSITPRKRSSKAVGALEVEGQVAGEGQPLAVGARQATGKRDPVGRVLAEVGVVSAATARQCGHRVEPAPRVGELVGGRKRHSLAALADHLDKPAEDVAPAVAPGNPARRSDRDLGAPAGLEELLGELEAGLSRPDYEHGPVGQRGLIAVVVRVELRNR